MKKNDSKKTARGSQVPSFLEKTYDIVDVCSIFSLINLTCSWNVLEKGNQPHCELGSRWQVLRYQEPDPVHRLDPPQELQTLKFRLIRPTTQHVWIPQGEELRHQSYIFPLKISQGETVRTQINLAIYWPKFTENPQIIHEACSSTLHAWEPEAMATRPHFMKKSTN